MTNRFLFKRWLPSKEQGSASARLAVCPLGDSVDPSHINVLCLWARKLRERLQPDGFLRALGNGSAFLLRVWQNHCFLYFSRENARCRIFPVTILGWVSVGKVVQRMDVIVHDKLTCIVFIM